MAIEIRELVIKTEIRSSESRSNNKKSPKELKDLKKEILKECKRLIVNNSIQKKYKR